MQEKQDTVKELKEPKSGKLRDYTSILFPFALAHASYNLVLRSTFTFTPSFLVEYKGLEVFAAGLMAVALPFAGIFAKLGSGFILERTGSKNAIGGAIILSSVFIAFLVLSPNKSLLTFNLVVLGLTLYSFSPIIYSSTASCLPSGLKAFGLGVVTMFGNIVGAISIGMVGALIDAKGYGYTFYSISVVTALSGALIFRLMPVNSTS
jgi:MFS family permease